MKYIKIIHGWVEQTFDENGICTGQEFVANGVVDRINEDDDRIEDAEVIDQIMSTEKHVAVDMVQP